MSGPILRLFRFCPVVPGAIVDARLRDETLPALMELAGLRVVHVGRRGSDPAAERILVSIWDSEEAIAAAVAPDDEALFEPEARLDPTEVEVETFPIAVEIEAEGHLDAVVLRVFTGIVHGAELDAYIEEAREGTLEDVAAGHGPTALYLGSQPPDRFVTVSTWRDWAAIESATGGNIHRPIATRHATRLAVGTADHYELVPGTTGIAARRPAVVD